MPDYRSFRLQELADILKIGEKTLNVWRHRYKQWIPQPLDERQDEYPEESLPIFRFISKCAHAAMEPDEIERALSGMTKEAAEHDLSPDTNRQPSSPQANAAWADILRDVFSDIVKQQSRIAEAHERRASAEERKAYALESRAEAELIKANALKDMVSVIQSVTEKDSVSALMDKVKSLQAPSPGDMGDFSLGMKVDVTADQLENLPELEEAAELDLPEEVEEQAIIPEPEPADEPAEEPVMPEEPVEEVEPRDVDDLSMLLEDEDRMESPSEPSDIPLDVDDLSMLLEPEDLQAPRVAAPVDIDDLSMLIDEEAAPADDTAKAGDRPMDVDDLSRLLDPGDALPEPSAPAASPKPEPAGDKEAYKSRILKRIIHMKQKENLSVAETTRRFNEEGVKTLSGKGEWDEKTIQGIYKYIDSVQAK